MQNTNIPLMNKMHGREIGRQAFGQLRDLAAHARHSGEVTTDEEEEQYFRRAIKDWLKGVHYEARLVLEKEERLDKWHPNAL